MRPFTALSRPLPRPLSRRLGAARDLARWPLASQEHARRNALVASTHLAARAHERREVESYLDHHARRWETRRWERRAEVTTG